MKKLILSLMSAALGCAAFAANCVSVKQTGTDYTNHKITIVLTRSGCTGDATNHRNTVWVFVDYREVTGATKGAWTRATISTTSSGTVVSSGNSKGAWINGVNGTQTVTLTLSSMPAKYDWCAFATDYPPNATLSNSIYTLKGSPPFILSGNTEWSANTYTGSISAITDATNNPEGFVNIPGCSTDYISLGTVGFISTQTWVVGAQTWSAPVTATYCNKSTFDGGRDGAFNGDCRTNPGYDGHLFSWCMVAKFKETICPGGWHVPTTDDFCTLDKVLNSRSNCATRTDAASRNRYLSTWGGQYAGYALSSSLSAKGAHTYYWSQSESDANFGYNTSSLSDGRIFPQIAHHKYYGFTLRCVK